MHYELTQKCSLRVNAGDFLKFETENFSFTENCLLSVNVKTLICLKVLKDETSASTALAVGCKCLRLLD